MHTQSERSAIRTRNALQVRAVELRAADVHQDQRAVLVAVELPSSNDGVHLLPLAFPDTHIILFP
jgi:hypothetical protein